MDLREEATMNQYYALIGDIIESRSLANRAKIQEALSQALNGLNERYQGHLASCFSLTLGDEFQGLLKVGAPIFQMIDELRLALPDLNLRFGLGLGEILTSINPAVSLGADGPAYWRAREAIQQVHQQHHYETVHIYLLTGRDERDAVLNHSLALSEFVRSSWIQSQMETFRTILNLGYYQSRFDQKLVATALGLSSSAFAKRMKSSGIKLYLDVKNDLNQAIENLARQVAQGGEGA